VKTATRAKQAIIAFPGNNFAPDYVMFLIAGNCRFPPIIFYALAKAQSAQRKNEGNETSEMEK